MAENENDDALPQEEGGNKTSMVTILLGVLLAAAVLALFYSMNGKSKLEEQVQVLELQVHKGDSLLEVANLELKRQAAIAEQNAKKAHEAELKTKKTTSKATPKKAKARKK